MLLFQKRQFCLFVCFKTPWGFVFVVCLFVCFKTAWVVIVFVSGQLNLFVCLLFLRQLDCFAFVFFVLKQLGLFFVCFKTA